MPLKNKDTHGDECVVGTEREQQLKVEQWGSGGEAQKFRFRVATREGVG